MSAKVRDPARDPWTFLFLVSIAVGSCAGEISGPPVGPEGSGGTAGPGGKGSAGGPAIPSPDTGLWRLTRAEYSNTLRDLLGDTTRPGNALDADASFNGLDNNAQVLRLSAVDLDRYDSVAAGAVERAFRSGSASRKKLLAGCDPVASTCARTVVSAFARRAWRGRLAGEDVDDLMKAIDEAGAEGDDIEEGVKLAFRIALVSPNFLYRVETDPPNSTTVHPVTALELATRLSYFLWSSTPDDKLLALADDGSLGRPETFTAEIDRMLADSKADALVSNFAAQWLDAGKLQSVSPDTTVWKTFNDDLRKAMTAESQLFFKAFLQGPRSLADMLDSDFTYANEPLANHYGIPFVKGPVMRKVSLPDTNQRFGLLSQAGLLTLTSSPKRTSPVQRGKHVLARLLCSPPPPPPPAPPLPADPTAAGLPANATVRDLMAKHRAAPACASCHAAMDPIGFALEHYDGVGRWRAVYPNNAIDATGELPDGVKFDGARQLSLRLKEDPRFLDCFAKTVFTYAFGREPVAAGDVAAVERLAGGFARRGGRIQELIRLIATSEAFQLRGGRP